MQLKESHAVVTGGASGLGLAVAGRIIKAGGKVTLLDVNEAQGTTAAGQLGDRASFIATDVTDESVVNGAIDQARERMGSIDAAVNCAGIGTPGRFLGKQGAMAGAFFRKMIEINLSYTPVTDDFLKKLATLRDLEALDVRGTQITDAGLESLNAAPALKNLYLSLTKVTDEGADRFRESHPNCNVQLWRPSK